MDRSSSAPAPPLIALERVNVHLDGRHVLHDVAWRLGRGEQWAFVGPNGSGKSTLLRVIRGDCWIDRDGGVRRYALDGARQAVGAAAPLIGYVSPELHERYARLDLGLSGRTFVATGLHDAIYLARAPSDAEGARVDAVLDRFGIRELGERPVNALSFGQFRLLLVARALVREPRVLVLDECANGLDRRARVQLLAFLEQAAGTTHVVVASHRLEDLPGSTTAHALIAGGRITEVGAGLPVARRSAATRSARDHRPRPLAADVLVAVRGADVYRGETRVLRRVEWTLRRGEHCVIRGENGSGKSTFAGFVAGTIPAAFGAQVTRFGAAGPFDLWELKRRIAHVSDALQTAYDVDPLVKRVIASGFVSSIGVMHRADAAQQRIAGELMRRLEITHLAGRRFLSLSFGERRKVLIARGLVNRPEVLILDEVWAGLDASFRAALAELLAGLAAEGTTLVVISHHDDDLPAFVRHAYVIAGGKLAAA